VKAVIAGNGDYILSVKDNQPGLKQDIADYVQDKHLRKTIDTFQTSKKIVAEWGDGRRIPVAI
jgi:hypothetical protein